MRILLAVFVLCFSAPVLAQDNNVLDTQYYGHLRDTCKRNVAEQLWKRVWGMPAESLTEDTCCRAAVDEMEQKQAREKGDGDCPEGFQPNMLRCITTKTWCEKKI